MASATEPVTVDRFGFEVYFVCANGRQGNHINVAISVPQPYGKWFFSPESDYLNDPWSFDMVMLTECKSKTGHQVAFEVRNITKASFVVRVGDEEQTLSHNLVLGNHGEITLPGLQGVKLVVERKLLRSYTENSPSKAIRSAHQDGVAL